MDKPVAKMVLASCPFCGSSEVSPSAWDVKCSGCGAEMPGAGEKAIAAWIRRSQPSLEEEVGKAMKALDGIAGHFEAASHVGDAYMIEENAADAAHLRSAVTLLQSLSADNARLREERDALGKASANPWCPDVCPITGRRFFMWIDGAPTYGGPFDSYTIPTRDADGEYSCRRYDHDEGGWKGWTEGLSIKIVDESDWLTLEDRAETAEARLSEAVEVLTKISCPTQTEGLLWWQIEARQFLDTQGGGNG